MLLSPKLRLFSPKLQMWYKEAHRELEIDVGDNIDDRYAIYPKRFYKTVASFGADKRYNYCFIGAMHIDARTSQRRGWILDFVQKNFSEKSYLQFTDRNTKKDHVPMGVYDFTLQRNGFVPKEERTENKNYFDPFYFQTMCNSQFTLCPGGDENWSMRFYEALMCKSIPILLDRSAFRTQEERTLDYQYYTVSDEIVYSEEMTRHNYELFLKYHTLEYRAPCDTRPTPTAASVLAPSDVLFHNK